MAVFMPSYRWSVYPIQLILSCDGALLAMRQLYFEQTTSSLTPCVKYTTASLKNTFAWLYAGTPACKKTLLLGPFTLAGWACIGFSLLYLILVMLYEIQPNKR